LKEVTKHAEQSFNKQTTVTDESKHFLNKNIRKWSENNQKIVNPIQNKIKTAIDIEMLKIPEIQEVDTKLFISSISMAIEELWLEKISDYVVSFLDACIPDKNENSSSNKKTEVSYRIKKEKPVQQQKIFYENLKKFFTQIKEKYLDKEYAGSILNFIDKVNDKYNKSLEVQMKKNTNVVLMVQEKSDSYESEIEGAKVALNKIMPQKVMTKKRFDDIVSRMKKLGISIEKSCLLDKDGDILTFENFLKKFEVNLCLDDPILLAILPSLLEKNVGFNTYGNNKFNTFGKKFDVWAEEKVEDVEKKYKNFLKRNEGADEHPFQINIQKNELCIYHYCGEFQDWSTRRNNRQVKPLYYFRIKDIPNEVLDILKDKIISDPEHIIPLIDTIMTLRPFIYNKSIKNNNFKDNLSNYISSWDTNGQSIWFSFWDLDLWSFPRPWHRKKRQEWWKGYEFMTKVYDER